MRQQSEMQPWISRPRFPTPAALAIVSGRGSALLLPSLRGTLWCSTPPPAATRATGSSTAKRRLSTKVCSAFARTGDNLRSRWETSRHRNTSLVSPFLVFPRSPRLAMRDKIHAPESNLGSKLVLKVWRTCEPL